MRKRKLYLDACILVSYYNTKDKEHKKVVDFLEKSLKLDNTILLCSNFTIAEFAWVCIKKDYLTEIETYQIANALFQTSKVGRKYPFKFVNPEANGYSFEDFFLDIQGVILGTKPRPHLADAIHIVIMKRDKIIRIVTNNPKDFSVAKIRAIKPEEI